MLARHAVAFWRHFTGIAVAESLTIPKPSTALYSTTVGTQESLEEIRARIFGNHIGNGLRSGRKLLRKKLVGDKVANYYMEPIHKNDPMFVDMDIER